MGRLIDDCNKLGLSLSEFIVLLYYYASPTSAVKDIVVNKGLLAEGINGDLCVTISGSKIVETLLSEDAPALWQDQDLIQKMQDLFPSGKKGDTAYYYKGSKAEIGRKLKSFLSKYPEVTKDQIIQATMDYVNSFHGDYKYLQLLKYFIEKEGESQLIAYIENIGQENEDSRDSRSVVL